MQRRQFLKSLSAGFGVMSLTSLFPSLSFAVDGDGDGPFFVMLSAANGWDTSLAMAPWTADERPQESDYFLEYRKEDLIKTSYGFVGPAMAPLGKYLENIRIINGVFMNATEVGHTSPQLYAMTGNGQGALSTLPAEIDFRINKMPFGTVSSGQIINSGKALNVISSASLLNMNAGSGDSLIVSASQKDTDITRAKLSLIRNNERINSFLQILADLKSKNPVIQDIDAAMAAFASGLSKTAFIDLNSYALDTHSAHPGNHKKNLTEVFEKFATLLKKFDEFTLNGKSSLLSKTTFILVSEFTRTPALNGSQGKDHNPQANSFVVMGPKIKPGITGDIHLVKRADTALAIPYLAATPIDKQTELPVMRRENAMIIRPENVMASVISSMDMAPADLGSSIANAQILQTMLK
ncbi:MAG: DUF1501 domain-containing protein [Pseudobdellovibrionaceae bacterium]